MVGSNSSAANTVAVQQPRQPPSIANTPTSSCSTPSNFQNVILYYREEDNPRGKLQSTRTFCQLNYEINVEFNQLSNQFESSVKVNSKEIGRGSGASSSASQDAAASDVLKKLAQQCYSIVIKSPLVVERKVERHEIMDVPNSAQEAETVPDDSGGKASRMMKMMGWSGGGLGKEEQGRTEPVMPVQQSRRAGMGSASGKIKFNKLKEILTKYVNGGSTHDLVFSADFESAERKEIHTLAHRLGLKSGSRAKGDNRFLVISRKWSPKALLAVLMDPNNSSEKFQLIAPGSGKDEQQRSYQEKPQTQAVISYCPERTGTESRNEPPPSSDRSLVDETTNQSHNNGSATQVLELCEQDSEPIRCDDEFDAFGKYVALKLRSLKENQRIFARKLINDVIFKAELEVLKKDCDVLTCADSS